MSERVHPAGGSPSSAGNAAQPPAKSIPPASSYVIQVPKDQVYRYPPAAKPRASQIPRRSRCCCCVSWILGLLLLLIVLAGIAAAVLYLFFRPKIPSYSIEDVSIKGFNVSRLSDQASLTLSPEFDVAVRAENPNGKIGIYYEKGSSVSVFYSNIQLCKGVLPAFYQGSKNVTVFQTALTGNGVVLSAAKSGALAAAQRGGNIPMEVDLRVPVKVKFGAVKTWTVTVKVGCDLTVDRLTENAKIVNRDCNVKVDVF